MENANVVYPHSVPFGSAERDGYYRRDVIFTPGDGMMACKGGF